MDRHKAPICKSKGGNASQKDASTNAQQQFEGKEEEHLFLADFKSKVSGSNHLLIDFSCTNHMTFDRDLFKDFKSINDSLVRIGNGDYLSFVRRGVVKIITDSRIKSLVNVLFVPELDQNLLNIGQLLKVGFKVMFEDLNCLIYDKNLHRGLKYP
jgi:hypothetical protein